MGKASSKASEPSSNKIMGDQHEDDESLPVHDKSEEARSESTAKFLDEYLKKLDMVRRVGKYSKEQTTNESTSNPEPSPTAQKIALFELVQFGFKKSVERLRDRKCFGSSSLITLGASEDFTPLLMTADHMKEEHYSMIVTNLCEYVNSYQLGHTPLHVCTNGAAAKALIDNEADIYAEDNKKQIPLHLASANETDEGYKIVKHLIFHETLDKHINFADEQGRTALHLANRKSVVDLLIKKGATINVTDKYKNTPLHFTSEREAVKVDDNSTNSELAEIVDILLSHGANLNARDYFGRTPLHRAKTEYVIKMLIKKGADIHVKDIEGYLALHWAVEQKNKEKIQILLSQSSSTINDCTNEGDTPLHIAVAVDDNNVKEIMQFLLDKGAKLDIQNSTGNSPLHLAAQRQNDEILRCLLDSKPSDNLLQITDRRGRTPLHLAAKSGHHMFLKDLNIIKLYSAIDKEGNTPLHLAAIHKQMNVMEELFRILEESEIPLEDIPNKDGDTVLHLATREGHKEIVQMLLNKFDRKYLYNAHNSKGCTPIHVAAQKGHKDILIKMFYRHMPLVNSRNWEGATALHLAVENKHQEVAEMILNYFMGDLRCEVDGISTKKLWEENFPDVQCNPPTLEDLKRQLDTQNLLLSALYCERDDVFKEILSQLPDEVQDIGGQNTLPEANVTDNDKKYTLLQVACLLGLHTCVDAILERNNANHLITSTAEGGCKDYSLLLAASWGYFEIVCKYKSYFNPNFKTKTRDETGLQILMQGFQNTLKDECSFFSQVNLNKKSQDFDRCVQELVPQQGEFEKQN